jgi:hypothetical protein
VANAQGKRRPLRSDGALDPSDAQTVDEWFRSKATPPCERPSGSREIRCVLAHLEQPKIHWIEKPLTSLAAFRAAVREHLRRLGGDADRKGEAR